MSEEQEQMYEFNTDYTREEARDSKPSIPPISTFTKGNGHAGGGNGTEGYPTNLYNSKDDSPSMANLESNNNDSSNTDSSSESMSVASPSQQQKQSQQAHETQDETAHHQQLLQQPQAYSAPVAGYPYTNQQVLVTSTSPETNGVLASHVIHSGTIPTSMVPAQMSLQGHTVIPFMAPSSSAPAQTQGIISSGGHDHYPTSAMHLLTSQPAQPNASVIQVNDSIPVQPTVLPHNIDLQQHLQQHHHQQPHNPHPQKNGSDEDKGDQGDESRKITLATLVPHPQMQPPIQAGANPRPGLPPHLMQLNTPGQTTSAIGGHVPQHFIPGPGPIPIQGSIATGSYSNAQVPLPQHQQQQQVPTSVVCMPPHIGPPHHGMVEQPNPMIGAGPGPGGIGMPAGVEEGQHTSPASSSDRRKRRGNKKDVPVEEKDSRYFERRDRNNKAAKRSRDARKVREEQVGMRAHYLEKENDFLRAQLNTLREEANSLRLLLAQRPPVNQMPPSGQPPMQ